MSFQQLTLNVQLRDSFRFSSFYTEPDNINHDIVGILKTFISSNDAQQNILWGEKHSGKTHLLQACCAKESEKKQPVSYIPIKDFMDSDGDMLNGLSHSKLIVLDDIDVVMGNKEWELSLFNLINITRENKQRLLMSSTQNPRLLNCFLPDLSSRLIWGGSYQLQSLSDQEKPRALQQRAEQRGFELSDRVIEYLYRRYPRDFDSLLSLLNKLDKESLRKKTLITIPFVKLVLGDS